ncbi:type IV toxin-antitoxin system AbiEi family antitoxin domain-containing protein [Methanimicrococcus hacksteinii]|nr:type IV toxin-antitoxin system AbiEi family antitoxin domain-containing protein [Methanimicrococcus sp. At1]
MNKLNVENFKKQFMSQEIFNVNDFLQYYETKEPDIPKSTVNWRIHNLVQKGVIHRVGRGLYKFGETKTFTPELTENLKKLGKIIQSDFPGTNFCVWELSVINRLSHHLINYNIYFAEIERDVLKSVYYDLKEHYQNTILVQNLYEDLSEFNNYIILKPLVTDSPLKGIENIPVPSLEKLLVDLCADKEFSPFCGSEIYSIYQNAFNDYSINCNKMFRYARRKGNEQKIIEIIETINRQ